uniref:snRNA-activating protein complex subunit 4 n=1 Tax=Cacopsylla melanoneura TaxID=428564 RepID=A0A8D9A4K4_9HEMI
MEVVHEEPMYLDLDTVSIADSENNIDRQVEKLLKENEHFIDSVMCIEGDGLDQITNKEYVEVNEELDCYMLQEKVDAVLHGKRNEDDKQSVFNHTVAGTDVMSLKEYLGPNVNKRHYYLLIQKNNTLLNDAQQFRARLVEKLAAIDTKIKELSNSQENAIKPYFYKRFYTYRQHYFIDKDLFPCGSNSDKTKIDTMGVLPIHFPLAKKWNLTQMETLKKLVGTYILQKKLESIRAAKEQLSQFKPDSHTTEKLEALERELEIITSVPEDDIPLYGKGVSIEWNQIALGMGKERSEDEKSAEDCCNMWNLCLSPKVNQKAWSTEEDKKLTKLAKRFKCENWELIAKKLDTGRTAFQCFTHYQLHHNKRTEVPWSKKEDQLLLAHMENHKYTLFKNSSLMPLAFQLKHRSFEDIRSRVTHFNSKDKKEIKKGPFTDWEISVIETGIKMGLTFKTIAELLGNRTSAQLRDKMSRKYSQVKRKGVFTVEEDRKLMDLTIKYGIKSWAFIAKKMKTRDRTQCRHRYNNIISNLKQGKAIKGTPLKDNELSKEDGKSEVKKETVEDMLDLLSNYNPEKKKRRRKGTGNTPPPKCYGAMLHTESQADKMIQEYFQYVQSVPTCTNIAVKPDVLARNYKGDALLAICDHLQVSPSSHLIASRPTPAQHEVSEYWNLDEYPFVIDWYQKQMIEQKEREALNLSNEDNRQQRTQSSCTEDEEETENVDDDDVEVKSEEENESNNASEINAKSKDIDLRLPACYLSNRYTIHSLLQSDLQFYKSNIVHTPLMSKKTQSRVIVNNNGASTRNQPEEQAESRSHDKVTPYYFPPSTLTLNALKNYKNFKEKTADKQEVWLDYKRTPKNSKTPAGEAALNLFTSRLQTLLTTSYLLVKATNQKKEATTSDTYSTSIGWFLKHVEENGTETETGRVDAGN